MPIDNAAMNPPKSHMKQKRIRNEIPIRKSKLQSGIPKHCKHYAHTFTLPLTPFRFFLSISAHSTNSEIALRNVFKIAQ